jgi:hypothetical protein
MDPDDLILKKLLTKFPELMTDDAAGTAPAHAVDDSAALQTSPAGPASELETFYPVKFQEWSLQSISPPKIIASDLGVLTPKHLVIMYKPTGGNDVFFYNQDLVLINDTYALYAADKIYFTNQRRRPNADLEGTTIFEHEGFPIEGKCSLLSHLTLIYTTGGTYTFTDEYSFIKWTVRDKKCMDFTSAKAFIA